MSNLSKSKIVNSVIDCHECDSDRSADISITWKLEEKDIKNMATSSFSGLVVFNINKDNASLQLVLDDAGFRELVKILRNFNPFLFGDLWK